MLVTTGEHDATRWGFRMLLEMDCCDIIQPDVGWCGGVTELIKIANLAESHGKLMVPHGSSVYSYHFVITRHNSPFAEFLMMAPKADKVVPMFAVPFGECHLSPCESLNQELLWDCLADIATSTSEHTLFLTDLDMMGFGTGSPQDGDLVVLFFGAQVPLVVRPQGDEYYSLIGVVIMDEIERFLVEPFV